MDQEIKIVTWCNNKIIWNDVFLKNSSEEIRTKILSSIRDSIATHEKYKKETKSNIDDETWQTVKKGFDRKEAKNIAKKLMQEEVNFGITENKNIWSVSKKKK